MTKELLIVRHGETEYNRKKMVQGSGIDSTLNETGRKQSELFYNKYGDHSFDLVVTSSLKRSIETMQPFIEQGIEWKKRSELNEINWGVYEGSHYHETLIEEYRNMVEAWRQGDLDASLKGGESARALSRRLDAFIEEMHGWNARRILICSHGRTIRCLLCRLQSWPMHRMESFEHTNTGLFTLREQNEGFELIEENSTEHLTSVKA